MGGKGRQRSWFSRHCSSGTVAASCHAAASLPTLAVPDLASPARVSRWGFAVVMASSRWSFPCCPYSLSRCTGHSSPLSVSPPPSSSSAAAACCYHSIGSLGLSHHPSDYLLHLELLHDCCAVPRCLSGLFLAGVSAAGVLLRLWPPSRVARPPPAASDQAEGTGRCALRRSPPQPKQPPIPAPSVPALFQRRRRRQGEKCFSFFLFSLCLIWLKL